MNHPYSITVNLLWGGYNGDDVDRIRPDFVADRPVKCQLEWAPSCEGPDSYRIFVVIGAVASFAIRGFLTELGKDMYRWCKTGIGSVFGSRPNAGGWAEVRFEDTTIVIPQHPASTEFADSWLALPEILESKDLSSAKEWVMSVDSETRKVDVIPVNDPARQISSQK